MTFLEHSVLKNSYSECRKKMESGFRLSREYYFTNATVDKLNKRWFSSVRLQDTVPDRFKIGLAVLAHERPEYLELCLDSLFQTKLYDYDITFLIQDDGSKNPRVREIIEREHDPHFKIVRYYTGKGHNSWGAAFNKAMRKLMEIDDFDIIGSCDSDAFFHPEWLDKTMKICIWAKKNHADHILGPFSSFNSSDYLFHKVLGTFHSPHGNYVVKKRMGALNYFYFTNDFKKMGFFDEHRDDETRMTEIFEKFRIRNFSTETSYVEHIGKVSVLNQWRQTPVKNSVYGLNLVTTGWPKEIAFIETLGYYKYIKGSPSSCENCSSTLPLDIIIPCAEKDLKILPHTISGIRENLKHPIHELFIISPDSRRIEEICNHNECTYIREDTVLPIKPRDIPYVSNGIDRSGWLYQQFLKLAGDLISSREHFFVLDADTVLIRPQVFETNNKIIFLHSDEYILPYYDAYQKLLGYYPSTGISFVAHQMLFQRSIVSELRDAIEENNQRKPWYSAIYDTIDRRLISSFSEYELYGHWMMDNHRNAIDREYWFNYHIPFQNDRMIQRLSSELRDRYRSISFHSYL